MDRNTWKKKIIKACKDVGTYQKPFEAIIDTLASILEKRDLAEEMLGNDDVIIEHTNQGGATNLTQHPAVRLINDLNRDALAYWRDLGLTPKGLKVINEEAMKEKKSDALTEALKELGG